MAWNWQVPQNLGPLSMSELSQAFERSAQADRARDEFAKNYAIQQQQANYLYPKELSMSPNMLGTVYESPLNPLSAAAELGSKIGTQRQEDAGVKPMVDFMGRPVGRGDARTSDVDIPSDDRQPAGWFNGSQGELQKIRSMKGDFGSGLMAKRMGLEIDPETGRIFGPGRQVKEYYDMYDKITQLEGNIIASAIRPVAPSSPTVLQNPNRGSGRAPVDPTEKLVNALNKEMSGLLASEKLRSSIDVAKMKNETNKARVYEILGEIAQINKQRTQGFLGGKQVAQPPLGYLKQENKKTGTVRYVDPKTGAEWNGK